MLTQNMSYVADHSGRSNAIYIYLWKLQACRASGYAASNCLPHGRRNANVHTFDAFVCSLAFPLPPATAPCMNESAPLNERLPPTTLLTSTKPANLQNADKESSAQEGWLDDDKFGAEDNGPCEGYMFFSVDLKPVLPVALAVSTVMPACACYWCRFRCCLFSPPYRRCGSQHLLRGFMALSWGAGRICAFADPGQVKKTRNMKNWCC